MDSQILCPCGTGFKYGQCCGSFHSGEQFPTTAEALMRSRFSAYALGNNAYILDTWVGKVAAEKIDFSEDPIVWERLEVLSCKKGSSRDAKGTVEFRAYYRQANEERVLHELSRFVKLSGRWLYADGVVRAVGKVIPPSNTGKNAPCPCGSGIKYKRCCGAG